MKTQNIILSVVALFASLSASAQSLQLTQGSVSYVHSSAHTGNMEFTAGAVSIEGKQYQLANGTTMQVVAKPVADNTVSVAYNGSAAQVVVAGNIAKYLTVGVSGAHVSIVASPDLQQAVSYTLSGTSADGSFYMDGKYAASFTLDNLSLTNPDSAAVNIQDGKRIDMVLSGTNTLTDGTGKQNNACLYINGHATVQGDGSLTVVGNAKHGITGDEHLTIAGGTINVSAVGDGLHISEYFEQIGGSLTVSSVGDGIDIGFKGVNKGTKDTYKQNGFALLNGGSINLTVSGDAAKGIKADSTVVISGTALNVVTTGSAIFDTTDNDISSSAALKTGGQLTIESGTVSLTSKGDGGKGINATGDINISGGELTVVTIGDVFTYGTDDTKPHGAKTDGNINITGGKVLVAASPSSGTALKTDYYFTVSGGTIMAIGAKQSKPTTQNQACYTYSGVSVKAGQTLTYNGVSFTIPSIYNNANAKVMVSGGK